MKKILTLIFLFCLTSSYKSSAQNAVVHTDKPYYVTGEVVWYKVYLPEAFPDVEGTLKVIISDASGSEVDSYFHKVSNDNVIGHYAVPFGISTGQYTFNLGYLNKLTNQQDIITRFSVPIYNDLEKLELSESNGNTSDVSNLAGDITLRFDKTEYNPGEEVRIGINTQENIVDYSISVIDQKLIGEQYVNANVKNANKVISGISSESISNGIYVQGQAKDESGKGKRMNQLGVYDGAANRMYLARTNDDGTFTLTLPNLEGSRTFQFAGYISNESDNLDVTLSSGVTGTPNSELMMSEEITNYLEKSRIRKKIHQFYSVLEYEIEEEVAKIQAEEVKPDKSYDFSEYVQFKSLGEFFNEIISAPLKFEIKGEDIKATMYDSEGFKRFNQLGAGNNFIFEPIFIVNGKLTKDASYVYKIPFEEVSKVDLYLQRKSLAKLVGNFRDYGITVIHTKNSKLTVPVNDEKNIETVNGVQPNRSFSQIKSLGQDMPQLRPLVYWNPSITDGSGVSTPLSIKATDDISTFQVSVVARTDSGKVIKGNGTYSTVRKDN